MQVISTLDLQWIAIAVDDSLSKEGDDGDIVIV